MANVTPITGNEECIFVKLETTGYDVITQAVQNSGSNAIILTDGGADGIIGGASGDGLEVMSLEITPTQEYLEIEEHTCDASLEGEVEAKRGGTYTMQVRFRTKAAGTPPNYDVLLQCAYGQAETDDGGPDSSYKLLTGAPFTFQAVKHNERNSKTERISGCWVESLVENIPGGGELPSFTVSGGFASYAWLYGEPTLDGNVVASAVVVLDAVDTGKVSLGMTVDVGADDNSGAGFVVIDVDNTVPNFTVNANVTASADDIVTPHFDAPAFATSGTVLGGIACDLSIDGLSVGFISYTRTLETGNHPLDRESTSDRPTGVEMGSRRVTGEAEFYFKDENVRYLGEAWDGNLVSLIARVGANTTGERVFLNNLSTRIHVAQIEVPFAEEATYTAGFTVRKSAAADDESTTVHD